jgi:hypothetical protein
MSAFGTQLGCYEILALAYNSVAALALVLHEAKGLMRSGEDLYDVLEAFSELFIHP